MSDSSTAGSWAEILRPGYAASTATLCLGVGLLAFNSFLAATALPTAVIELDGLALISWATTLYLVFAIIGGAGAALLKQALGARNALLFAAAIFLLGSLVAALAGGMPQVLVGRVIQGAGEGIVAAICYTLIPELFPSRLAPKVFGMLALMWGIAAFGGPVGVGALTEAISWRAAFFVNVPLVLVFAALVFFVAPRHRPSGAMPDFPGLRLLAIGLGIVLVALAGIVAPLAAAGLLILAALLLVAMVLLDRRARTRLLPTGAFTLGSVVGAGLWVVLLLPVASAGAGIYIVLLLEELWGFGPTLAGAVGALMAIAWSTSAIAVANISSPARRLTLVRVGPAVITLGLAGILVGCLSGQLAVLLPAQVALGAGFGMSWSYLSITLMEASSDAERDRTSALLPTMQSAGTAIGAAIAGLAANAAGFAVAETPDAVRTGIAPALIAGIIIALLGLLLAIRTTGLARRAAAAGTSLAAQAA
jgi:MFS family permease